MDDQESDNQAADCEADLLEFLELRAESDRELWLLRVYEAVPMAAANLLKKRAEEPAAAVAEVERWLRPGGFEG